MPSNLLDWKALCKCMYIYRLPFSNTMHACGTALYCYTNFLNLKFFSVSKLIFMTLTCWHLVGSVSCPCVSWGWLTNEPLSDPPSRIRVTEITQSAHVSDRPGFWIISISQLNRYPICLSMLYQCFFMTNRVIWFVWQCYINSCLFLTNKQVLLAWQCYINASLWLTNWSN